VLALGQLLQERLIVAAEFLVRGALDLREDVALDERADRVVAAVTSGPLVGRTEADVAREIRERLVAEGRAIAGTGGSLADLGLPPPIGPGPALSDVLAEIRGEDDR